MRSNKNIFNAKNDSLLALGPFTFFDRPTQKTKKPLTPKKT
jgi:hypothetical protein